ncbi:PLP-dependent transferase [Calocera cornea HHB12733]|uniref:PLP-dependent transferase n=1 Tax=Calocera cornea HHB12733 TaxID=1353952 RepID=A0A165DTI7_9BASI|nr:PLP-dependent transferase [Calocera cornea HHB12733]
MPSAIRGLFPLELTPGLLSMLAGKPNPDAFPINSISVNVQDPWDTSKNVDLKVEGKDMAEALQYGATAGMPRLAAWFADLQEKVHGRGKGEGWRVSVGSGSQDLLYKAFLALLNPEDSCLIEAPVYAGVIPMIDSIGCNIVEVPTDYEGIDATHLREILEAWPEGKPYPKVLYTVPYGCNPSGATAPDGRRREVLALARKYHFLIMEDDPYFYLYFGKDPRPTSYFALEKQDGQGTGHVIRFDSLSKILSSGLRIAWASGPTILLDAFDLHTSTANLQPSSTTQAITYAYLKYIGLDGFIKHTDFVSAFYGAKAAVFERAMQKHLAGLATWAYPNAGMFFWFKLLLPPAPGAPEGDSNVLIAEKAFKNGVLALPGTAFFPKAQPTPYVRAAFSLLTEEEADEALRRLAETVRQEQHA